MPRQKLAEARRRAGLSQKSLAEKVDAHRVALARIEAGLTEPRVGLALRLAHELGETVETLFGGER